MKEKIIKLLTSDVQEDLEIGLEIIRDWSWEEIQSLGEPSDFKHYKSVVIAIRDTRTKSWAYQFPNFYCHRNLNLFIYKGQSDLKMTEYIKL